MKKSRSLFLICVCLQFAFQHVSKASTILYSDRANFYTQLGNVVIDDYDSPAYLTSGGTDSGFSSAIGETDYFDLPRGATDVHFVGGVSTAAPDDGSKTYCHGCSDPFKLGFTTTSVGDSSGVFGVGFDIVLHRVGNAEGYPKTYSAFVEFGNGSNVGYALPLVDIGETDIFWGITSTDKIKNIYFCRNLTCWGGTAFSLDNLTIASAGSGYVIPLPSALWLFGSGLLGLIGIAKSKSVAIDRNSV